MENKEIFILVLKLMFILISYFLLLCGRLISCDSGEFSAEQSRSLVKVSYHLHILFTISLEADLEKQITFIKPCI